MHINLIPTAIKFTVVSRSAEFSHFLSRLFFLLTLFHIAIATPIDLALHTHNRHDGSSAPLDDWNHISNRISNTGITNQTERRSFLMFHSHSGGIKGHIRCDKITALNNNDSK